MSVEYVNIHGNVKNYKDIDKLLLVTCDSNEKLTIFEKKIEGNKYGSFE